MVKSEDGRYECSSWRYYLSGTCLFTSSSVVATPFLLLKRRIQMGSQNQSIFSLFKTEGIWGSFRGGSLSWISGANRMLYFTIYEKTVYMFGYSNIQGAHMSSHSKESFINASAAAVSSFVSQAVLTPVSVVTTHMHVHHCPHLSPRQVFLQIVSRNHSWGALWTGYPSALLQAIPTNMTLFAVYTFTKNHAQDFGLMNSPMNDLLVRLSCSLLGTYMAVLVTSPIDIVRTHRQALVSETMGSVSAPSSSALAGMHHHIVPVPSSFNMMKEISNKYGWRHLYSGQTARLFSSAPFTVAMLIGYDYIKIYSRVGVAQADLCY